VFVTAIDAVTYLFVEKPFGLIEKVYDILKHVLETNAIRRQ
jgi:hypothetical protein